MTTATKRPTIEDLVNRTKSKERDVLLQLHNYLLNDNNELYHYLDSKKKLENFLISRTDNAINAYKSALLGNVPNPEEVKNEVLFIGIENSISEYVESLLDELPDFKRKLVASSQFKEILKDLSLSSVSIFYSMINTPYSISQEKLDDKLIKRIRRKSKTYSLKEVKSNNKLVIPSNFKRNETFIPSIKKVDEYFEETFIPF